MDSKQAEQLAAHRLLIGFHGTVLDDETRRMVERVAGVVLFSRNVEDPEQVASLNAELIGRTADSTPLLICVDQEGGPVARLRDGFTVFPAAGVLGAIDDVDATAGMAGAVAAELVALGFNLNFAPVVDVNTNPENPVIGVRSFGSEPKRVSRHACAYIEALQETGVMACAKHFPGHGDTTTDSHHGLPVVPHDPERMARVELEPFCQATAANVASVMTAHVMFPAYDEDNPATLSPAVLGDLLRTDVGYGGVCITDDLEMKAITQGWGVPEAAVKSIAAGADLILICHTHDLQMEAVQAIAKALVDGELDETSFGLGTQRILNLKQRYLPRGRYVEPDLQTVRDVVACAEHMELKERIEERARNIEPSVATTHGGGAADSGNA